MNITNNNTQDIMTKTYIKPELEVLSMCSVEGVLAASTTLGGATGEGITLGEEFNPWN